MEAATMEYLEVLKTDEMRDGEMRSIPARGKEILIAKIDGGFYAAQNTCPHLGGKLAKGVLKGTVVTCPRHASQFDLKDGHVVRWTDWSGPKLSISKLFRPPRPLPIYPMKIEGDRVLVEI
jgi:3-phenylpropionate/trans-cinnamate dioxygenase ferredoxin subunit